MCSQIKCFDVWMYAIGRTTLILSTYLSCSHLFHKLCDLTWYQSYRLTPVFDPVPIFFFVHSSCYIFNHNQNKNAHKYSSCAFFFLGFLILPHFVILYPSYFSFLTHVNLSLFQDDMPHFHCFLY
jgi:hypothetical protein